MLTSTYRKSSYSGGQGACVEARTNNGRIQVRDTKLGEASPVLGFAPSGWSALLSSIKAGQLDL